MSESILLQTSNERSGLPEAPASEIALRDPEEAHKVLQRLTKAQLLKLATSSWGFSDDAQQLSSLRRKKDLVAHMMQHKWTTGLPWSIVLDIDFFLLLDAPRARQWAVFDLDGRASEPSLADPFLRVNASGISDGLRRELSTYYNVDHVGSRIRNGVLYSRVHTVPSVQTTAALSALKPSIANTGTLSHSFWLVHVQQSNKLLVSGLKVGERSYAVLAIACALGFRRAHPATLSGRNLQGLLSLCALHPDSSLGPMADLASLPAAEELPLHRSSLAMGPVSSEALVPEGLRESAAPRVPHVDGVIRLDGDEVAKRLKEADSRWRISGDRHSADAAVAVSTMSVKFQSADWKLVIRSASGGVVDTMRRCVEHGMVDGGANAPAFVKEAHRQSEWTI